LVAVAAALMSDPGGRHWGYELSRQSRVRSGVMYPVLRRMLDEGWLADGWEDQAEAGREKRPPRRYYEVTELGRSELGALVARARADGKFARLAGDPQPGWAAG
jgi:PadR family transcriptional regulator PadR